MDPNALSPEQIRAALRGSEAVETEAQPRTLTQICAEVVDRLGMSPGWYKLKQRLVHAYVLAHDDAPELREVPWMTLMNAFHAAIGSKTYGVHFWTKVRHWAVDNNLPHRPRLNKLTTPSRLNHKHKATQKIKPAPRPFPAKPFGVTDKACADHLGRVFPSITDAARALDLNIGNVGAVLKGKLKHCGGYVFRYLTPEERAQIPAGTPSGTYFFGIVNANKPGSYPQGEDPWPKPSPLK